MDEIVNANDVRMSQVEAAPCLALELIKRCTILDHQIGKKFQREIALQLFIARQPDYSHSSSSEDLDQRVTTKNLLSAGKLTRCRRCDATHVLVSHLGNLFMIKMERKVKAKLGWSR